VHQGSFDLMGEFVVKYLTSLHGKPLLIADVGSLDYGMPYKVHFTGPGKEYWLYYGIDLERGPNVDIIVPARGPWSPKWAESFDVVISGQMLEHCWKPWLTIKEMAATLRHGGLMCIIAPNTWHYHAFPDDNWRFWPEGFRALFDEAELTPLELFWRDVDTVGIARKL
jgi:SAM-dependent methyltransferase